MISTLFSSLNIKIKSDNENAQTAESTVSTTQPVLLIMQKTMPIFKDIATLWINELTIIEVILIQSIYSTKDIIFPIEDIISYNKTKKNNKNFPLLFRHFVAV